MRLGSMRFSRPLLNFFLVYATSNRNEHTTVELLIYKTFNVLNHARLYIICAYILQQFKYARSSAITATAAR